MKKIINLRAVETACLCALIMLAAGCSTMQSQSTSKSAMSSSENAAATTGATDSSAQSAADENSPVYYDFIDILVPGQLRIDKKDSLVMASGGVSSGIMVLRGNVDVNSLSKFFENKMPVDGWRQMGSFRSARSIFLFEKETRWCVIAISEGSFNSTVEIWVAPMDKQSPPGLNQG